MKNRKLNRLKNWDYSSKGWYYVTICVGERKNVLGEIGQGRMELNIYGQIVERQWKWMGENFENVILDKYVIMPNHVHGLIRMVGTGQGVVPMVGTGLDLSVLSVSKIIGAFKTTSSKLIHMAGLKEFKWHRSFYDEIIWDQRSLDKVRWYLQNNPKMWEMDINNKIKN